MATWSKQSDAGETDLQVGAGRPRGRRQRISNLPLIGTTTDDVTRGSSAASVTSSRSAQFISIHFTVTQTAWRCVHSVCLFFCLSVTLSYCSETRKPSLEVPHPHPNSDHNLDLRTCPIQALWLVMHALYKFTIGTGTEVEMNRHANYVGHRLFEFISFASSCPGGYKIYK